MSKRIISQSEVDAFLSCKRKHYYAHGEKIAPKQYSEALNRGTIGHECFDTYFTYRKNGESHDASANAMMETLNSHYSVENLKVLTELTPILSYWVNNIEPHIKDWKVLEIEKEFRLEVPGKQVNGDTLVFPFKIDLLVEHKPSARVFLVDHKFLQDFYSGDLINVLPQLAKYVGALRMLGVNVKDGIYHMIRTRPMKSGAFKDKIKIQNANLSDTKIKGYLREQFSAMRQIRHYNELDLDAWREKYALRSANQFNCRTCPFLDICTIDLTGAEGRDLHVKTFYQENTYGYEELD